MEEESEVDEEEEEEVVYRCLVSCGNARLRALRCCRKLSMQSSGEPRASRSSPLAAESCSSDRMAASLKSFSRSGGAAPSRAPSSVVGCRGNCGCYAEQVL